MMFNKIKTLALVLALFGFTNVSADTSNNVLLEAKVCAYSPAKVGQAFLVCMNSSGQKLIETDLEYPEEGFRKEYNLAVLQALKNSGLVFDRILNNDGVETLVFIRKD